MKSQAHPIPQLLPEQHIPPQADSLFLLGRLLAKLNAQGLFLEDLFQHAHFSYAQGRWVLTKQFVKEEVSAQRASKQLTEVQTELDHPLWTGLLSGYTLLSRQWIDPNHPSFTSSLLADLYPHSEGKSENSLSESFTYSQTRVPQGIYFDVLPILDKLSLLIRFEPETASLITNNSLSPSITSSTAESLSENDILLTTLVLLFAGVDLKVWIEQGERLLPKSSIFKILGAFLRKDYTKQARVTGILPRLFGIQSPKERLLKLLTSQPLDTYDLLKRIAIELEQPSQKGDIQAFISLLQYVKGVFEINVKEVSEERCQFLEAFSSGLISLSKEADRQESVAHSLHLAQTSFNILQWIAAKMEGAESRLSEAELQAEQLSWTRLTNIEGLDTLEINNLFSYANTASLTDLMYFKHSREQFKLGKATNHLWSALYRAIDRQRWILSLMDSYIQSPTWSREDEEDFKIIFTYNVKQFQGALAQHMKAAKATFEKEVRSSLAECWLGEEAEKHFIINKELILVTSLIEELDKKGLPASTLNVFKELINASDLAQQWSQERGEGPKEETQVDLSAAFNELIGRYHAGEENLLPLFEALLSITKDTMMQLYCRLLILLLAAKGKKWETVKEMITYLHNTVSHAWDLPGIPTDYQAGLYSQELGSIDPILDALRMAGGQFPTEQVISKLLDRYLERYIAK